MSLAEVLHEATMAYKDGDNAAAVKMYTEAMNLCSEGQRSKLQMSRARAYFRLGKRALALSDCSQVLSSDPALTSAANQLKGECFLREGEPESALEAFQAGIAVAKPNTNVHTHLTKWIEATQRAIDDMGADSDVNFDFDSMKAFSQAATAADRGIVEAATPSDKPLPLTAAPVPPPPASAPAPPVPSTPAQPGLSSEERIKHAMTRPGPAMRLDDASDMPFTAGVLLAAPAKYRWQFNQNSGNVEVQVFAKQLNKQPERVSVAIESNHIKVEIKDEECKEVVFSLDEDLYQEVDVSNSKWAIWGTQVNIKLKKADASVHWSTLGKSDVPPAPAPVNATAQLRPAYPTSAKSHRDWDNIEQEVKKEEKEEDLQGDAALNRLFQQIYSNADEDTRRAMNKSFQESGGTSLSTNWKEVKDKNMTCEPPEGVKVKKFEY